MDCIRTCQSRITTQNKYLWVIEGDIKGCFDHVQHPILIKLLRRRLKDQNIIDLISRMLKAGVIEKGQYQPTPEGTPQGGILSPLLTNIYLHEFDRWWWQKYGSLSLAEKARRRKQGVGNCILTRYADDVRRSQAAREDTLWRVNPREKGCKASPLSRPGNRLGSVA
jgi:RNA-directed DNA polymerase